MKTYVVLNDVQIPFHEPTLLTLDPTGKKPAKGALINFIRDIGPDGIILNGDIVDCYDISDFTKDPLQPATLLDEILHVQSFLQAFQEVPIKVWLGGNHEDRFRRYIWKNAPKLGFLKDLSFPRAFNLDEFGFRWLPYGDFYHLGRLLVTHGWVVRKHSAMSAKAHFEDTGNSILIGHTHRLGTFYRRDMSGPHLAVENGCLCSLTPEYCQYPNWQQGLSIVQVKGQDFFHTIVPAFHGGFYYGGKIYK